MTGAQGKMSLKKCRGDHRSPVFVTSREGERVHPASFRSRWRPMSPLRGAEMARDGKTKSKLRGIAFFKRWSPAKIPPERGALLCLGSIVFVVVGSLFLLFLTGGGSPRRGGGRRKRTGGRVNRVCDGAGGVTDRLSALFGEAAAVALQLPAPGEQDPDHRHGTDDRHDEPDGAPDEVGERRFFMTEHCVSPCDLILWTVCARGTKTIRRRLTYAGKNDKIY